MRKLVIIAIAGLGIASTVSSAQARDFVTADDQARFVAGLAVAPDSPLAPYMRTPVWQEHALQLDAAWDKCEQRALSKARAWAGEFIGGSHRGTAPMFYMFSGPDILFANTMFPNASTYVLCAAEPIGSFPDLTKQPPGAIDPALANLRRTLNTVLRFSYFITKDMRADLADDRLKGTVPVMCFFLARLGCTVQTIEDVQLDVSGHLGRGKTPGVKITFSASGPTQTLYYFKTDLSNGGIKNSGVLPFCERLGDGSALLKAASYLMHGDDFSTVRSFLLNHCRTIVQDDSGIPLRSFDQQEWKLRYFGNYIGPIELFQKYYQRDLAAFYAQAKPAPLDFALSYRNDPREAIIMVGTRSGESRPIPRAEPVR
ncbi:MAG: hypothetical protein ABI680_12645 [Chthoniobacteraceae bacterium]